MSYRDPHDLEVQRAIATLVIIVGLVVYLGTVLYCHGFCK